MGIDSRRAWAFVRNRSWNCSMSKYQFKF